MGEHRYYALVASLPKLPHFEQGEYVPITRQTLESRLRTLDPAHLTELQAAGKLTRWQRQPRERTTADIISQYAKAMKVIEHPALRDIVEYRMGERTVMVALRMRKRGERPQPDVPWGVGRWTRTVEEHWDDADLGVRAVFPWVEKARSLVDSGNALQLERTLLGVIWDRLTEIEGRTPFGFERIIAFVFKWDLFKRWLSYDPAVAKERFQELTSEVTRDHQQLFA
ncbi:MAG: hypothetical protein AAF436_14330 [Myxococcota bacterium]